MKVMKILLAFSTIAVIGFLIWNWDTVIEPAQEIEPPKNLYTQRIEIEIDSLIHVPVSSFCDSFYRDIQYRIDDFHSNRFLGVSVSDNDQWHDILSKNLYSAYAPKFGTQAMHIFSLSDWYSKDLIFIRSELRVLEASIYLDSIGPVSTSFNSIHDILDKYDEISSFIQSCKLFSYTNYDISYPFPDLRSKIDRKSAYIANNLDNSYVNNCARLKAGLNEIPKALFDKRVSYLRKKIMKNSGRYDEFDSQADYSSTIYTPLQNEVNDLYSDTYGVGNSACDNAGDSLDQSLSDEFAIAAAYFRELELEKRENEKLMKEEGK